jgi:hypothetical protein
VTRMALRISSSSDGRTWRAPDELVAFRGVGADAMTDLAEVRLSQIDGGGAVVFARGPQAAEGEPSRIQPTRD